MKLYFSEFFVSSLVNLNAVSKERNWKNPSFCWFFFFPFSLPAFWIIGVVDCVNLCKKLIFLLYVILKLEIKSQVKKKKIQNFRRYTIRLNLVLSQSQVLKSRTNGDAYPLYVIILARFTACMHFLWSSPIYSKTRLVAKLIRWLEGHLIKDWRYVK